MRKLVAFNQMTLDGYFADTNGDIRWAHKDPHDAEWNAFVADNAKDKDENLRQWECLPVLRADGVRGYRCWFPR